MLNSNSADGARMDLVRLIYISNTRIDPAKGPIFFQLTSIVDAAKSNNRAQNITGALTYDNDWFVQILEGPSEAVRHLFRRIERDPRHLNIVIVEIKAVESRRFANWWMGCVEISGQTASVFKPYLRDGRFMPSDMSGDEILSLMSDLCPLGFDRHLAA
jgi:hypothetical protein